METVTVNKTRYETLKRQAAAWRRLATTTLNLNAAETEDRPDDTVIFDADRDSDGKGIPINKFIATLRKLQRKDRRTRA